MATKPERMRRRVKSIHKVVSGLRREAKREMKPTFLILGAAKCGTTSLYRYLRRHPQICMSQPKEPLFFEFEYEKGLEYYWKRYFSHWQGEVAVGEARQRNLYLPFVPPRVRESLPEAKLIVLMRNPVDRAYAHWWEYYHQPLKDWTFELGFEEAIEKDMRDREAGIVFEGEEGARRYGLGTASGGVYRFRSTIVDSGYYAEQIERYRPLFPESQMKILFFEDLCADHHGVALEACDFVGVGSKELPLDKAIYNPSAVRLSGWLRGVTQLLGKRHLPQRLKEPIKRALGERRPDMHPETRRALVEHYYEHNRRVERLTGRDVSHWDR